MSDLIVPGRHHADGNGVLRHMHGRHRDRAIPHKMTLSAPAGAAFARSLFLSTMTAVRLRDQGSLGCCVGESYAECADNLLAKQGKLAADTETSELGAYDMVREFEGVPLTEDSGAQGFDMVEVAHVRGVCSTKLKPFSDDEKVWTAPITDEQREDAAKRKLDLSLRCPDHASIKHALTQGFAVMTGFTCFENLMSREAARTGHVKMPEKGEKTVGAHEVVICGWDDKLDIGGYVGAYILRNHWGEWGATYDGIKGYLCLPFAYWDQGLAEDNNCPRLVEVPA